MTSGIIYRLFGATLLCLSTLAYSEATEFQPKFPRTMSWSAYNLGTTGYNQAVGIGKALKDHYNVNLRILPGKNLSLIHI